MNRNGYLSGFTDLQWGMILVVLLIIFFTVVSLSADKKSKQAISTNDWEAQWLANSLAQHPLAQETVLAASKNATPNQLQETMREFVNKTDIGTDQHVAAYVMRDGSRIACAYRRASVDRGPFGCSFTAPNVPGQLHEHYLELIDTHASAPEQLRTAIKEYGGNIGIIPAPHGASIGVLVTE